MSRTPPEFTMVFSAAAAVPRPDAFETDNLPLLTVVTPVYVFAPESVTVASPVLVIPPLLVMAETLSEPAPLAVIVRVAPPRFKLPR